MLFQLFGQHLDGSPYSASPHKCKVLAMLVDFILLLLMMGETAEGEVHTRKTKRVLRSNALLQNKLKIHLKVPE
jgi:hypothetical protein